MSPCAAVLHCNTAAGSASVFAAGLPGHLVIGAH